MKETIIQTPRNENDYTTLGYEWFLISVICVGFGFPFGKLGSICFEYISLHFIILFPM